MFKFLESGMVEITAKFPTGIIDTTVENLKAAAVGEHKEWALDYPALADTVAAESFPLIATMYRNIAIAEKAYEKRRT
jgi:rubrerythrin